VETLAVRQENERLLQRTTTLTLRNNVYLTIAITSACAGLAALIFSAR
jgi:hypothetical protein